jgi:hypothetical protein
METDLAIISLACFWFQKLAQSMKLDHNHAEIINVLGANACFPSGCSQTNAEF